MLTWAFFWFMIETMKIQGGGKFSVDLLFFMIPMIADVGIFFMIACAFRGWPQ